MRRSRHSVFSLALEQPQVVTLYLEWYRQRALAAPKDTVKHSKVAQITCLWVRLAAKLKVISKNVSNMTLRQWTRLQNIKKSASYVKNCVIQLWKGSFYRPHLTMVYFTVNVEHRKKLFCFWTDLDEIRCVDVPWVDTCTYQILSRLVKNWLRRTAFNFTT